MSVSIKIVGQSGGAKKRSFKGDGTTTRKQTKNKTTLYHILHTHLAGGGHLSGKESSEFVPGFEHGAVSTDVGL